MQPIRPTDVESRLQEAAERIDAAPDLSREDIDAYREVYRAIRAAPMPPVAPDFARSLEQLTRDHAEQAAPEIWIARLMIVGVVAGVAASVPAMGGVAAAFARTAQAVPWPIVMALASALAVAALIDRTAAGRFAERA